ncbi:hypothetical protein BB934_11275 [Microvirga ossetica]|uniref:Uncharacterized protein n=2 Tax=Microvirga ossetica TaxID=1882682 RepID=A0A1B2EFN4_9HYPH|nr:hypothetical protein BB934_11275 [Microvirga ossetica]
MGWAKQFGQNFAVTLEHGTFFRSAADPVNSSRFIAFYFRGNQTSIRLILPNFQDFGEFFRMMAFFR